MFRQLLSTDALHHIPFLGLCVLTVGAIAVPKPATYTLHEKRASEPLHWEKRSRVGSNVVLPVRIGLIKSNLDKGPTLLDEVSTPGHPNYGQHYTADEIHDLFAPEKESVDAIRE